MRIGTSWRSGPGRRTWISMSPLGWLLFGWVILAGYAVIAAVWLLVVIVRLAAEGVVWCVRKAQARREPRMIRPVR